MQLIIETRPGTAEIHTECLLTLLHSCSIHSLHQTLPVKTWDSSTWQMESDEWGQALCSALMSSLRSGRICGSPRGTGSSSLWAWGKILLILLIFLLHLPCPHLLFLVKGWILVALGRISTAAYYCCLIQGLTQGGPHPFQERKQLFLQTVVYFAIFFENLSSNERLPEIRYNLSSGKIRSSFVFTFHVLTTPKGCKSQLISWHTCGVDNRQQHEFTGVTLWRNPLGMTAGYYQWPEVHQDFRNKSEI